ATEWAIERAAKRAVEWAAEWTVEQARVMIGIDKPGGWVVVEENDSVQEEVFIF
ncbi:7197_t:CDS:2, partial [Racocetra fulgida]